MKQMKKMSSTRLKESVSLLKSEDNFTGFEVNDDLLEIIVHKQQSIAKELDKERDTSMKIDDQPECSSPIINNTLSKKNLISSLEATDTKPSRNVNKRLKKEHLQNEAIDSEIEPILEFSTPTFSLTSTPKTRRSSARKVNIDITDPIFKLPFEHGWKRELVYRTSGDSTTINRNNRNGDVYYYSPNNRKLRSLREIQEQLDIYLLDTPLTIESFTFLKQPIGMDDKKKEIIRDANTKLSKEDSFIGFTFKSKKAKSPTPVQHDYELSDNENNKSSNKLKIVFKDSKQSKSKSKKNSKSNLDDTKKHIYADITPEDWQVTQTNLSNKSPKISPLKSDDIETNVTDNRRLSTSDGEIIMQAPCGIRCPNTDEPATLMCAQCLVHYHPACVNLNANLKIVGYVCVNCRSSIRHRNRRAQSSHTVVVGVSEPEQRVEPIRIRQVHQESDTPNFFIDKKPISKTEELNYEINQTIDENNSIINTATCQGKDYKTVMVEGIFQEQYVYEMKQTRGPSLMICVVQEPKDLNEHFEMNGSLCEIATHMQSFNYFVKSMGHVFSFLNIKELLSASRVCTAWNVIAMNKNLWQNVRLKNSMVYDWDKFVTCIVKQCSISLDTKRMLIPLSTQEYLEFWFSFAKAIKNAKQLKSIELYRCPFHVVEDVIYSLPELKILNASSIKNPNISRGEAKYEFMPLNLGYLGNSKDLTELRLKGLTGIKLMMLPSFEKLINLKILSITSIKAFPKDLCPMLETVTTGLEVLEIGDCDCLSKEFAVSLKRFINLTTLRLENCCGRWENFAEDVFKAIISLEKLRILELVNIEFSSSVEEGLEKCVGVRSLLIIPAYVSQSATTNCHLIECLQKLSKTLTHLVWGLTNELLRVTDLFITQYQQNQHSIGYNLELSQSTLPSNNIPILRTRKLKQRTTGTEPTSDDDQCSVSDNVDILSVPALEKLLSTMMPNAKTKVYKVPFVGTTRVFLSEHFNDL